jgi:hypothetical protein
MSFEIDAHQWQVPTRRCTFALALAGGSVFADFDVGTDNLVTLVRISFDGYGSCRPVDEAAWRPMNAADSSLLLEALANEELATDEVRVLLRRHFADNSHIIWQDALDQYDLLPNGTPQH